jgi:tubulin--tyrosine ligase
LVKLYWELAGQTALDEDGDVKGTIDQAWLQSTFDQVGQVIAETVTAAVKCGSFGLQLLPNAFEVNEIGLRFRRSYSG